MATGLIELRELQAEAEVLCVKLPLWQRYREKVGSLKKREKWETWIYLGETRLGQIRERCGSSWADESAATE